MQITNERLEFLKERYGVETVKVAVVDVGLSGPELERYFSTGRHLPQS